MKPHKPASVLLPQKQPNSGSIHDLSSEHYEREIRSLPQVRCMR